MTIQIVGKMHPKRKRIGRRSHNCWYAYRLRCRAHTKKVDLRTWILWIINNCKKYQEATDSAQAHVENEQCDYNFNLPSPLLSIWRTQRKSREAPSMVHSVSSPFIETENLQKNIENVHEIDDGGNVTLNSSESNQNLKVKTCKHVSLENSDNSVEDANACFIEETIRPYSCNLLALEKDSAVNIRCVDYSSCIRAEATRNGYDVLSEFEDGVLRQENYLSHVSDSEHTQSHSASETVPVSVPDRNTLLEDAVNGLDLFFSDPFPVHATEEASEYEYYLNSEFYRDEEEHAEGNPSFFNSVHPDPQDEVLNDHLVHLTHEPMSDSDAVSVAHLEMLGVELRDVPITALDTAVISNGSMLCIHLRQDYTLLLCEESQLVEHTDASIR